MVPFVESGFFESVLPDDQKCYHAASQMPAPVNRLFENDIVGESEDYFDACIQKLTNKITFILNGAIDI